MKCDNSVTKKKNEAHVTRYSLKMVTSYVSMVRKKKQSNAIPVTPPLVALVIAVEQIFVKTNAPPFVERPKEDEGIYGQAGLTRSDNHAREASFGSPIIRSETELTLFYRCIDRSVLCWRRNGKTRGGK